jgi:hypothetical protein
MAATTTGSFLPEALRPTKSSDIAHRLRQPSMRTSSVFADSGGITICPSGFNQGPACASQDHRLGVQLELAEARTRPAAGYPTLAPAGLPALAGHDLRRAWRRCRCLEVAVEPRFKCHQGRGDRCLPAATLIGWRCGFHCSLGRWPAVKWFRFRSQLLREKKPECNPPVLLFRKTYGASLNIQSCGA